MKISRNVVNACFLFLGLIALALLIREVTVARLLKQLADFGWAFLLVLGLEVLSNATSCMGWWRSFVPGHRPSYLRVLFTSLGALSVAGALPSGQAGEVVKGNLMRGHAPGPEIIASLLVYNVLHILTTLLVGFAGALVALFGAFELSVKLSMLAAGAMAFAVALALTIMLRLGLLTRAVDRLRRLPIRFLHLSDKTRDNARLIDERLRHVVRDHPGDFWLIVAWLIIGRLFAVAEVYVIMTFLGLDHSAPVVGIVLASTVVANYLLLILPAREGFLEGSTYLIFGLIGMNPADGLSLELIRRLRKIVYQLLGLLLLAGFGLGIGGRPTNAAADTGDERGDAP